jgi:hypothetical protein
VIVEAELRVRHFGAWGATISVAARYVASGTPTATFYSRTITYARIY